MSIKKANEFYEQLDQHQQQFIQQKEINATYSIRKWLGFFSKAVAYDTYADKALITLRDRQIWFGVGIFVTGIASFFLIYLLPLPVLFLVLYLKSVKNKKTFKGRDLNNYLRLFFFPVLTVLKDKAGEDAKLAASLNFNDPRQGTANKSMAGGRNVYEYEATYILAKVMLKDQSTLEFVVGDLLKDLNWTKRSASGKTKYKTKSKVAHLCIIKLSVPASKYSVQTPNLPNDISVEEKGDQIVLKKKIKLKRVGKDFILSPKVLFDGLQSLYGVLMNPDGGVNTGLRSKGAGSDDFDDDYDEEDYDDEAVMATVWAGSYFDEYDYDSFDYQETSYSAYDDEAGSIFDS